MGRYAAFRTSLGYGPETTEPAGEPPVPGAVLDGEFSPYGDDDRCWRWVVDLPDLEALRTLCETVASAGSEVIVATRPLGRYALGWDVMEGLDGIVEIYDAYRE